MPAGAVALVLAAGAPALAQSACPSGHRYQSGDNTCVSIRPLSCPAGYAYSAGQGYCEATGPHHYPVPACPTGYRYRQLSRQRGDCISVRAPSCPAATRLDTRTGRCVRGAIPQ